MQNEFRVQIATLSAQIAQVATRLTALETQLAMVRHTVKEEVEKEVRPGGALFGARPVGGAYL